VRLHWRLYVYEALELSIFMAAACGFSVLLFSGRSPVTGALPDPWRQVVFAAVMGAVATGIITSPMGRRSGAHFNPACTITYLRLGKITRTDALCYVVAHFVGAVLGVGAAALVWGNALAAPGVDYAVSAPGRFGVTAALAAELFMAVGFMTLVLWTANRPRTAKWTAYLVGLLIAIYLVVFGPISGVGLNPARSTGSAVFADVWTAFWVYLSAPVVGMLTAAAIYVRMAGPSAVLCAKLEPSVRHLCPFLCQFPGHRHTWEPAPDTASEPSR
jgi:aquaporin Z